MRYEALIRCCTTDGCRPTVLPGELMTFSSRACCDRTVQTCMHLTMLPAFPRSVFQDQFGPVEFFPLPVAHLA